LARPTDRVAARAYLRARLLDILIGDWSRRADQWRWAAFATPSGTEFRPIPRDRDQAFFRFDDGWLTRALSWVRPRYQTFNADPTLAQVDPLTVTARPLDETVLSLLPEAVFQAEAIALARCLTDSVYNQALLTVPPEVRPLMTRELLPALRVRRGLLPVAAARYYRALQVDAAVIGTDAAERFVVQAEGPGRLRLQVWAQRPAHPDSLLGEHHYDVRLTRRLRVYGLGGNDQFDLRGRLAPGFAVWLDGGAGTNRFTQQAPATSGLGISVHAGPQDLRQLSTAVSVRPLAPTSRDAASWIAAYYRLRLGSK
jgi:hypothetical protein